MDWFRLQKYHGPYIRLVMKDLFAPKSDLDYSLIHFLQIPEEDTSRLYSLCHYDDFLYHPVHIRHYLIKFKSISIIFIKYIHASRDSSCQLVSIDFVDKSLINPCISNLDQYRFKNNKIKSMLYFILSSFIHQRTSH